MRNYTHIEYVSKCPICEEIICTLKTTDFKRAEIRKRLHFNRKHPGMKSQTLVTQNSSISVDDPSTARENAEAIRKLRSLSIMEMI